MKWHQASTRAPVQQICQRELQFSAKDGRRAKESLKYNTMNLFNVIMRTCYTAVVLYTSARRRLAVDTEP